MHICLFDIDGTLLNTGGAGQAAMEVALETAFGITAPTSGIPTAGRTDRAITQDLFNHHGLNGEPELFERFLSAYLDCLPNHLGNLPGVVLPGVQALLERLSERDEVALGLLTGNFREGARLKLEHFGLDGYFPFGGFGDEHIERDDVARSAMEEVRKRYGPVSERRVWVIGDTPADIRCGRAIGANVLAVGTGTYCMDDLLAAGPDHLVEDFADPHRLLALLE